MTSLTALVFLPFLDISKPVKLQCEEEMLRDFVALFYSAMFRTK